MQVGMETKKVSDEAVKAFKVKFGDAKRVRIREFLKDSMDKALEALIAENADKLAAIDKAKQAKKAADAQLAALSGPASG